jgi:hypothetical protein
LFKKFYVNLFRATIVNNLSELSIQDTEHLLEIENNTLSSPSPVDGIDEFSRVLNDPPCTEDDDDGVIELGEEEYEISYSDSEPETSASPSIENVALNRNTMRTDDRVNLSTLPANQCSDEILIDFEVPSWLSQKFRRGLISPTVMNVLTFQRIFILSQSEDYFSRPSHELCLPVLQLVVGIILGEPTTVRCHARLKNVQIGVYNIVPIIEIPSYGVVPNLKTVPSLNWELRARVILDGLDIPKNVDLTRFPEEWRLYVVTLVYWKKNCAQCEVNSSYIRTLFVCLIYLSIIDKKIGFARSNSDLKDLRKCSNTKQNCSENETSNGTEFEFQFHRPSSTRQYLEQISENDCFRAASTLLHYHRVDENLLKDRKRFNAKTVHAFAQLQHCMANIMLLNSVLDFPFAQYEPHRVFSGTFVYNFYSELSSRKLADGFITRTLLAKANSLIALYRSLINSWEVCISLKEGRPEVKKKKSRRRKNTIPLAKETDQTARTNDHPDDDRSYKDPDNIFSMLPEE